MLIQMFKLNKQTIQQKNQQPSNEKQQPSNENQQPSNEKQQPSNAKPNKKKSTRPHISKKSKK